MDQFKDQLFPANFILNYIQNEKGRKRFLSYIVFRFFSFAGAGDDALSNKLKSHFSYAFTPQAFSIIEDYLMEDDYFSPSFMQDSYDPLYLYIAISLIRSDSSSDLSYFETLLAEYCPVITCLSYADTDLQLPAILQTGADFYAALYLTVTHYEDSLAILLPKFTEAYQESYHFTCEDFILYDFMDEYFEQKNCIYQDPFIELINTLVTATLNYHNTDFDTLLQNEVARSLDGSFSRFAGTKRMGSIIVTSSLNHDEACHRLAEAFRYATIYELRNNLFDFHLEDDKLITLTNWKENLRWHYVQYANVYHLALDSFHAGLLSRELLKIQFLSNLN